MAGTGKRAHTKKPSIVNMFGSKYLGKYGFRRPGKVCSKIKSVNLSYINDNFENLLAQGIIKKEGNSFSLNLADMKKDKLLATGNLTKKVMIKAKSASKKAIEKVQKAGGSVETEEKPVEETVKKAEEKA